MLILNSSLMNDGVHAIGLNTLKGISKQSSWQTRQYYRSYSHGKLDFHEEEAMLHMTSNRTTENFS